MIAELKQTIEVLKSKIGANLYEIKNNEQAFKNMLKVGISTENKLELEKILDNNKALLVENFDFLNMQITLLKFLEKYKNATIKTPEFNNCEYPEQVNIEKNNIDYFEYTITGLMPFNSQHPCLYNDTFINKLLNYYNEREEYEKCSEIINIRKHAENIG